MKPRLILRAIRITNPMWEELHAIAQREQLTASSIIRHLIQGYIDGKR